MQLSKEDVISYATRYISQDDITDFPGPRDLFALMQREKETVRTADDGSGDTSADPSDWQFMGYGLCLGYQTDEEAKPAGKWVWFSYLYLGTWPPIKQHMRLQPPHVVLGRFSTSDRSKEVKIEKIDPETAADIDSDMEKPDRKARAGSTTGTKSDTATQQKESSVPGSEADRDADDEGEDNILTFPGKK